MRARLTEAEDDGELLHLVERGELDVTFVAFPILPGPFTAVELMADPYVVVVRLPRPSRMPPGKRLSNLPFSIRLPRAPHSEITPAVSHGS